MNATSPPSSPRKRKSVTKKMTPTEQARLWAMSCHLSSLTGFIVPLANVFVPLVIWLLKRDEYPAVDDQGKESINFQITMVIYYLIGALLILLLIGLIILPLLAIFNLVSVIIASLETYHGKKFRYVFSIRFIK
jgi:uncharacterized Tic20 family protein